MLDNAPRSALDYILEAGMRKNKEWFFPSGHDSSKEYKALLMNAEEEMKILCGYLKPDFYNQEDIVDRFSYLLGRHGRVYIAFNKMVDTFEEAKEVFRRENPNLARLKETNPKGLRMFWLDDYPLQHYSIIDSKNVFWETSPHAPNGKRTVSIRRDDPIVAKLFLEDFEREVLNVKDGIYKDGTDS